MSFWLTLADLLLPRHCVVCGAELTSAERDLCNVCLCQLVPVRWSSATDNPLLRILWDKYDVEVAGSSLYYHSHSEYHKIFIAIKYQGCPRLGTKLATQFFLMWYSLGLGVGVDLIIPIPLSLRRRMNRGYNQSEWIAKGVSEVIKVPVCTNILFRRKNNSSQTHKGAHERWSNTLGIFRVKKGQVDLNDKVVMIVDDIMTTGATLCDAMRALREAFPRVRLQVYTLGWSGD